METPSCSSCQFFKKPLASTGAYGDCVRYPEPIVHQRDHWCGEFKAPPREIRIDTQYKEPQQKAKK